MLAVAVFFGQLLQEQARRFRPFRGNEAPEAARSADLYGLQFQ